MKRARKYEPKRTKKQHKATQLDISKQKEANDRLSALPDKLLLHILSFLHTKEVVRTCLLSKRWQFLWTHLSELHLLETSFDIRRICSFVDCVGKMLVMYNENRLQVFTVDFMYDNCFASNINLWVRFAVKNKVNSLTLLCRASKDLYELPQVMYTNSSLTSLTIGFCVIAPRGTIKWGSLKSLSIDSVELFATLIEKILSGCPVLEFLRLRECSGLSDLSICSTRLTTLVIENWITLKSSIDAHFLEISAPYVRALSITCRYKGRRLKFGDLSSCVRASLDYEFEGRVILDGMVYHMKQLLEGFHSVKELKLGPRFIEVLSRLVEKGWKLPHSDRLCLKLNAWRHNRSIPGIIGLLKSSPNLKTLIIRGKRFAPYQMCVGRDQAAAYLQNYNLDLVQYNLKTVRISEFTEPFFDGEPMLTLVQLLLKRTVTLEKMVIDATDLNANGTLENLTKIVIKLLGFPRTSADAVIVVR